MYHAHKAFKILLPVIAARRQLQVETLETSSSGDGREDMSNFPQMMMDEAVEGPDSTPKNLAGRVLSLTFASIIRLPWL